jgi:hypothetical protein
MRFHIAIACAVALLGCAASSSAQSVSLQFNNGRVTLNTQNAPVRTILTEWARLGGTRIVNGDRVGGAPVTLELTDLPERQALDILLRSVAGYIVTERQGPGGVSTLGGVVILATSNAPRAQAPVTFGAATMQPPPRPLFEEARDADDRPGVAAAPMLPQPAIVRLPGTAVPFGQVDPTPMPTRPVTTIQTLPGTSRPGEITPPPPQSPQQQPQR